MEASTASQNLPWARGKQGLNIHPQPHLHCSTDQRLERTKQGENPRPGRASLVPGPNRKTRCAGGDVGVVGVAACAAHPWARARGSVCAAGGGLCARPPAAPTYLAVAPRRARGRRQRLRQQRGSQGWERGGGRGGGSVGRLRQPPGGRRPDLKASRLRGGGRRGPEQQQQAATARDARGEGAGCRVERQAGGAGAPATATVAAAASEQRPEHPARPGHGLRRRREAWRRRKAWRRLRLQRERKGSGIQGRGGEQGTCATGTRGSGQAGGGGGERVAPPSGRGCESARNPGTVHPKRVTCRAKGPILEGVVILWL